REAHVAAGLPDDQLSGGPVDPAGAHQGDHPVHPGGRDLAQGDGPGTERADPVRGVEQAVDRLLDPPWVRGLDPDDLELPVPVTALADRRIQTLGRLGAVAAVPPPAPAAPRPDPLPGA